MIVQYDVAVLAVRERHINRGAIIPIPDSSNNQWVSWLNGLGPLCPVTTVIAASFKEGRRRLDGDCMFTIIVHVCSPTDKATTSRSKSNKANAEKFHPCHLVVALGWTILADREPERTFAAYLPLAADPASFNARSVNTP